MVSPVKAAGAKGRRYPVNIRDHGKRPLSPSRPAIVRMTAATKQSADYWARG